MKPIVIYHDHCTDGFGAAFAAWDVLGSEAHYEPMSYNQHENVLTYLEDKYGTLNRPVYIVDFSLPHADTVQLMDRASKFVWLDHHKTAFEMWCENGERVRFEQKNDLDHILLDNNKSGALLAWEYFHPGAPIPRLIQCIDDRDRWVFELPDSKPLHLGLQASKPWTFEQWDTFTSTLGYGAVLRTGIAVSDYQGAQIRSAMGSACACDIVPAAIYSVDSHKAPWLWSEDNQCHAAGRALNTSTHMSEVGHELAVQSGTFGLVWYVGADGINARCSLRSNGDYDVSAIAKVFGGGGHKNAAGFNVPVTMVLGWLKGAAQ